MHKNRYPRKQERIYNLKLVFFNKQKHVNEVAIGKKNSNQQASRNPFPVMFSIFP